MRRGSINKRSVEIFLKSISGHKAVESISMIEKDLYLINRTEDRPSLKVLLVDIYIVGEADVFEIDSFRLFIDCVVLVGYYNKWSFAAKGLAKQMGFGIYDIREFYGAINCVGTSFINYERKA